MKRVCLCLFLLVSLGIRLAVAQSSSYTVKGSVISQTGREPLIGVSIQQKGTANGVITDMDGKYELSIQGGGDATLVFSYIGMKTQERSVSPQTGVLNVEMEDDSQLMDEVVVVSELGCGTEVHMKKTIGRKSHEFPE